MLNKYFGNMELIQIIRKFVFDRFLKFLSFVNDGTCVGVTCLK